MGKYLDASSTWSDIAEKICKDKAIFDKVFFLLFATSCTMDNEIAIRIVLRGALEKSGLIEFHKLVRQEHANV